MVHSGTAASYRPRARVYTIGEERDQKVCKQQHAREDTTRGETPNGTIPRVQVACAAPPKEVQQRILRRRVPGGPRGASRGPPEELPAGETPQESKKDTTRETEDSCRVAAWVPTHRRGSTTRCDNNMQSY